VSQPSPLPQAEKVLRHAQVMLRPLVAWLLRSGVTYNQLANAIKLVFLEQADQELQRQQKKCTDSSLSTMSGLNRKIVKEMWRDVRDLNQRADAMGRPSLSSRVMTRWMMHVNAELTPQSFSKTGEQEGSPPIYAQGVPYSLLQEHPYSFEGFVQETSKDVKPRSVLNELQRLGLVRVEFKDRQEWIMVQTSGFVPETVTNEALDLLSGAVSDHLWTGVNNISKIADPELDRSVFASGLSHASVMELGKFAQKEWQRIFPRIVNKATQLYEIDAQKKENGYRMRIGMYFYKGENYIEKAEANQNNATTPLNPSRTSHHSER
jgi:Family of unknown function (DUF6502)